ncbi:hypothetical protein KIH74_17560 [Kineosporia sp. J2-2]|uniref:Uncharacterized protein n=1 Tax=Kineosporia corallincola TaxID=2835133 RepID=A0ABS5TI83_9ACTN|nr:hypothetical protein [Kineosporia corallincola]MBT0770755.1 hypothetical protein [Kineosporia corallincola]
MSEIIMPASVPSRRSVLRLGAASAATATVAAGLLVAGSGPVQAASGDPRPELNGLRVRVPNNNAIYLVLDGYRRFVPNMTTYNKLFRDETGIVTDTGVADIPVGPALSDGASLIGGNGVYLVSNQVKRHVSSGAAMDKYWFSWSKVFEVPQVVLDAMASGQSLS